MAYTAIDDPIEYFETTLYTGNGSSKSISSLNFQPDWLWIKCRNTANGSNIFDVLRGTNSLHSETNGPDADRASDGFTSLDNDGFTLNGSGSGGSINVNSRTYASWNWLAAGTAPSNTYAVKVVSDGGNKYRFDDFGTSAVTLELSEGGTFTFDQSDSSNSGHPLRFSTTANGSHGSGSEYTTGVTTSGTPGSSGAYTEIVVATDAPTLYYYCTNHSAMGWTANTPVGSVGVALSITETGVAGTAGIGSSTLVANPVATGVAGTGAVGTESINIGGWGNQAWGDGTWGDG